MEFLDPVLSCYPPAITYSVLDLDWTLAGKLRQTRVLPSGTNAYTAVPQDRMHTTISGPSK